MKGEREREKQRDRERERKSERSASEAPRQIYRGKKTQKVCNNHIE